jgi:hypothetical protein
VARWGKGERTVQFLVDRGRLESFEATDLAAVAAALIERAARRLEATATAALKLGDVDGAYAAAYDSYRMVAESLLARQGLRATGGDGSHMAVEDAVSAQFASEIPGFGQADLRAPAAHPSYGAVLRSFCRADQRARRGVGDREGQRSAVGHQDPALGRAA